MNSRPGASALGVAFLVAAVVGFLGMRWNMLEPRSGFPMGTKVMFVAAVVVAAVTRALARTSPKATILSVGAAIPAGAFVSMALRMLRDPTSENLWPVAVVALAVFALAAAALGTLVGSVALRLFKGTGR